MPRKTKQSYIEQFIAKTLDDIDYGYVHFVLMASRNQGLDIHDGNLAKLSAYQEILKDDPIFRSKLWNRLLCAGGIIGIMAPDMTGLANWLMSFHMSWLTHIAHGLGSLALLAASWSRITGRLAKPAPTPAKGK